MWTEIESDANSTTYAMQVWDGCIIRVRTFSTVGVAEALIYAPGMKLENGKLVSSKKGYC